MMPTLLNAVIGKPLLHSLSPKLHNAVYQAYDIPAILLPFEVNTLEDYLGAARTLGIGLTAVTLPYKEAIIPLLDTVDPAAAALGAVNTVIQKEGRLIGYNTDLLGIAEALKSVKLRDQKVLVLGCGGVARPLIHFLCEQGAEVTVTNRTEEKLKPLLERYKVETLHWDHRGSFEGTIVMNTTPVGMFPDVENTPFPSEALTGKTFVFDVIYNPAQTRLLREAEAAGAQTMNGLSLFVTQAYEQIALWRGLRPSLKDPYSLLFNS